VAPRILPKGLITLRRRLLRFLIGCHLLKASIASSRLLDGCSYDEGDASYDEDGGEDDRECGHLLQCLVRARRARCRWTGQTQHRQAMDAERTGRVIVGAVQVRSILGNGHEFDRNAQPNSGERTAALVIISSVVSIG
jgi:hypothetical protein